MRDQIADATSEDAPASGSEHARLSSSAEDKSGNRRSMSGRLGCRGLAAGFGCLLLVAIAFVFHLDDCVGLAITRCEATREGGAVAMEILDAVNTVPGDRTPEGIRLVAETVPGWDTLVVLQPYSGGDRLPGLEELDGPILRFQIRSEWPTEYDEQCTLLVIRGHRIIARFDARTFADAGDPFIIRRGVPCR